MKTKLMYVIGCLTITSPSYAKIPSFVGDLVARDLIGAGPLGHVGIASAPDYRMRPTVVLEAMNSAPHIQENTIDDFKSRSKFWGSKGGLLSPKSIESFTVANRIVRQYYACPEYTITWRWRDGKFDSFGKPIQCAQFRCDTLVNYAYAFSDGYSLPTYNTTWTTPLAVYNYFPVDSDLLMSQHATSPSTLIAQNITDDDINSINENNVKELDDKRFYQMLQNSPNISNELKYVNDIIYNLEHPDDSIVVTASYRYLTQILMNSGLNFFSNASKQLFSTYLDNIDINNYTQAMLYTSAYIEFKAALKANKVEEMPTLAYDYMQLLPAGIQEATFNNFTDYVRHGL